MLSELQATDNIAIFLPSFSGGGAERIMVGLANNLAQRGCRVNLVVGSSDGPWRSEVSEQVKVVDLATPRMSKAILPLASFLREERPDAVISALTHANLSLISAAKLSRYKGRVVVSERNSLVHIQEATRKKARLKLWMMKALYPSADAIICVSKEMVHEFSAFLGKRSPRLTVIYNPVDRERLQNRGRAEPEIAMAAPSEKTVVAVGRLNPQKDFVTLLEAFSRLTARDTHLYILGEGPERPALEELASRLDVADRVHLPGFVSNPHAFMARSHVFVLSSRYEGMPNALLEALACECHAVSTTCPTGPEEIMGGYEQGHLVPVGDAEAMAEAMDRALTTAGRSDNTDMLTRFEPETIVSAYLSELRGDMANAKKGSA